MKATEGDLVTVLYDGFLENGELFESSKSSGPLEFQIGAGLVMPSFEEAIAGMRLKEEKTFTIPAAQANGLSQAELIHNMRRSLLPNHKALKVGMVLGLNIDQENKKQQIPAMVTALDEKTVTVDFNHPLAGHDLTYKVILQKIRPGASGSKVSQP
ncbi:MAG: peptidylprolyl isomerase [Deltaproteobacteria bacterium]|nr:peptidylprolyl isomerase [Deltaproteobacteria bacterium]